MTKVGGLPLSVRGEPPEIPARVPSDFGAILVELLSRLPTGASAAWLVRVWLRGMIATVTATTSRAGARSFSTRSSTGQPARAEAR